jgi:tetratricopeptide (TPR) repeat protein
MAKKIKIKPKKNLYSDKSLKNPGRLLPGDAEAYFQTGFALQQAGRLNEAVAHYKKAIMLRPDNAEAYNNLGAIFQQTGKLDEALKSFEQTVKLRPDYAEACYNLGFVLQQAGRLDDAEAYYKRAIMLNPADAETYNNLGTIFQHKGNVDEALKNFSLAVKLKPDYAGACYNIGFVLQQEDRLDEAMLCYEKLLEIEPDHFDAYNNMGIILAEKNKFDEAIEKHMKALALKPEFPEAYYNLGSVFTYKGMTEKAIECYNKALALKPDYADVYNNIGCVLALNTRGFIDEAVNNYRKALALKPDDANIHKNLAMAYLLVKDFVNGWEEYEWRLKTILAAPLTKPKWDGGLLENRTIIVYAEQGYGDTLQFVRYLPVLFENYKAKKVLFIPQKGLEQLLKDSDLKAEILDAETPVEGLEYDTNIHLLSLPRIFKTNLENMPFRQKRYLKANPDKVKWYKEKYFDSSLFTVHCSPVSNDPSLVTRHSSLMKIGIFWQGRPGLKPDRNRSMPLKHFSPLCRLPDVKVYSLQKGYGIEQLNNLPEGIEIVNLGETFKDFSDTAAAIENLDLVITVDTAIGHLSGALGKKTWILLPSHEEWRWHLDMDYSPWYEDIRLFRHKEPGKKDWDEMMERVVEQVKIEI